MRLHARTKWFHGTWFHVAYQHEKSRSIKLHRGFDNPVHQLIHNPNKSSTSESCFHFLLFYCSNTSYSMTSDISPHMRSFWLACPRPILIFRSGSKTMSLKSWKLLTMQLDHSCIQLYMLQQNASTRPQLLAFGIIVYTALLNIICKAWLPSQMRHKTNYCWTEFNKSEQPYSCNSSTANYWTEKGWYKTTG